MTEKRVLVMAGGTGGHVYPGLAVADELRERGCRVEWLGTRAGMESRVVPAAGIELHCIEVSGLRGRGLVNWLKAPVRLSRALTQAWHCVHRLAPDAVLGMGGFAAGPGGLAAWMSRVPLVVHEQNAIPGLTNRVLARFANQVLEAFPDTFKSRRKVSTTGNPVRGEIAGVSAARTLAAPARILVLGGSQGAKALNEIVPAALTKLAHAVAVVHQCGPVHMEATLRAYGDVGHVTVVPFIDDMANAYANADLVVCRAGAMTVCEVAAAGRPALFIPFPFAVDDHQSANAEFLVRANAARIVQERNLDADRLCVQLSELLGAPALLASMGYAARAVAVTNAAARVADVCLEEMVRSRHD
ncbi:MAG: undecaprenyldiphospho-muramoylpentapeptide beta-N-acetylglucosaminyltransferase [Chromatiales bacterium]|jgi:UDP-N-acetylglucosamine--N-acetylmuramyl-(pentapeptide) pyrophosphoryl-undecaprenol N-acetylglucosamine transferase|nr:undecaprenyldiphospho-muramoylpentapeptide beta-N-acetylglucosaminyltransferase [Chromatiales bacterium]